MARVSGANGRLHDSRGTQLSRNAGLGTDNTTRGGEALAGGLFDPLGCQVRSCVLRVLA